MSLTVDRTGRVCILALASTRTPTIEEATRSLGWAVSSYSNLSALIEDYDNTELNCILIHTHNPGDESRVLRQFASVGIDAPSIAIVEQGDVPGAVRAMQAGATSAIEMPIDPELLARSIESALAAHAQILDHLSDVNDIIRRRASLSPREREVLELVVSGKSTRQIADELHRTEKTIEFHRRNIMQKMEATNVADLVRMVVSLQSRTESPLADPGVV